MIFYSMKCPKCGKWRSKELRSTLQKAVFKCFYCGKTTKIQQKGSFGLAVDHKGPYSGAEAMIVTKTMNGK